MTLLPLHIILSIMRVTVGILFFYEKATVKKASMSTAQEPSNTKIMAVDLDVRGALKAEKCLPWLVGVLLCDIVYRRISGPPFFPSDDGLTGQGS